MKKIFTLIAAALMAVSAVNAATLINYKGTNDLPAGVAISGSTLMASQKINANTTSQNCIQLKNGYSANDKFNDNAIILTTEGGFKAGDVLSITGFFNNSDDTKKALAAVFTVDGENTPTLLWTSEPFINGRTVAETPEAQTYTLEQDMEKIYIGRDLTGNTNTNIMAITVVRGTPDADDDEPQGGEGGDDGALVSYKGTNTAPAGVTLSGTTVIKSVKIKTNTTAVDCIQLANGYTKDGVFNENAIILSTDGGFKAGDVFSVTGFFNNDDNTKVAKAEIFTLNADNTVNVIWTSDQFINGRLVDDDPNTSTYTLEQDMEQIYIGRNGGTGTNITALSVVRGGTTVIKNITVTANGAIYNLAGQKVSADYKGVVVKNGVKVMQK